MLKNSNSSSSSPPSSSQDSGLCSVVALSTTTAAAFSSCGHMMMIMNSRAFDPSTIFSALHFLRFESCAIARTPILTYSGSYAMPSYLLFQNSQVCCLLPTVPLFFPILSPQALGSLHPPTLCHNTTIDSGLYYTFLVVVRPDNTAPSFFNAMIL